MTATLLHAPLACSLAVRIAAMEGNVPLDISYLNLWTKERESGGSLLDLNPLGQVSVLQLASGEVITETGSCLMWVQSQSTKAGFVQSPQSDTFFQLMRWISFCATELHKQIFRVVFYQEATDPVKDRVRELAPERFKVLDTQLATRPFLLGEHFTAADAYLTWFFVLSDNAQLDTTPYSNLQDYRQRVLARPALQQLLADDMKKDVELGQGLSGI